MKTFKQFITELNSSISNYVLVKGPGHKPNGFKEYMRGKKSVEVNLKEHNLHGFTIENLAKLYADYNLACADVDMPYEFPVEEVFKYKEYDRTPGSPQEKYRDNGEHYNQLKAKIAKDKKIDSLWLTMDKQSNGDVQVFLGEGNHRIAIAKELGIKTVKLNIKFI